LDFVWVKEFLLKMEQFPDVWGDGPAHYEWGQNGGDIDDTAMCEGKERGC
jgi:hypothetical protein